MTFATLRRWRSGRAGGGVVRRIVRRVVNNCFDLACAHGDLYWVVFFQRVDLWLFEGILWPWSLIDFELTELGSDA